MFTETTSLGLDVHARSVRAAAIDCSTGEVIEKSLPNDLVAISGFVTDLASDHGRLRITYEAGPTGFGLARCLLEAGHAVQVAAPSKLLRPSGERVKTDRRDALLLARLARNDDITAVRIPTLAEESARDLVRARDDARRDLMSGRHRLGKLLLRRGYVFPGKTTWGREHDAWLRAIRRDHLTACGTGTVVAFDDAYDAVTHTLARRDRLDAAIEVLAEDSEFTETTHRLACLRGISTLTAFGLAVEIGDWHRFTGSTIAAYLGLVPSEHSSGQTRSLGGITKTGNSHARRLMIESAWHHKPGYRPGRTLRQDWAKVPAVIAERADRGNRRLHHRWMVLEAHRKRHTIANTAIARELAGWCWSLATMEA
ncbi:MAG: IS110 family transposase [Brachybacterium sp.]|uniref:IS110 family transposase n=1 Tax=Brachybacterium sp. TaxID=1891286 RepID=UPI002647A531|nr:IS110 family transposase [Brachybacterium sp.]MDN5686610.1 IS110 family transposase [Brachybacterium sp.]